MEKTIILRDEYANKDVQCNITDKNVKVYMLNYAGMLSEYILLDKEDPELSHKTLFKKQFRLDRLRRNLADMFPDKIKKLAENELFIGYDFSGLFV